MKREIDSFGEGAVDRILGRRPGFANAATSWINIDVELKLMGFPAAVGKSSQKTRISVF